MNIIAEQEAFIVGRLHLYQKKMDTEIHKAVHHLADELLNISESRITHLSSVLARKDEVIKKLQGSLRKLMKERDMLKNELNVNDVKLDGMNENKLKMDKSAEMNEIKLKMDRLIKENKELKEKYKAKKKKIKQFELLFDDVIGDGYAEDLDEEDGTPSEDSGEAEDISMVDKEVLMNDDGDSDDSDGDDSEFELDDEDKIKMMKDEMKRKKVAKPAKEDESGTKKEEETEMKEEEETDKAEVTNKAVLE